MSGLQRVQRRIAHRSMPGSARTNAPARPRVAGARARLPRAEGVTLPALWRLLAISACALILGGGGFLAFQLSSAPTAAPGPEDHRRLAVKVASILGALPAPDRPRPDAGPTADDFARPAFLEPRPATEEAAPASAGTGELQAAPTPQPMEVAALQAPSPSASPSPSPAPLPPQRPSAAPDGRTARILFDVTMRSGPRRGASAIGQIDRNSRVTLIGCKSWCEVISAGKRGFVYRRAVDQNS